MLIAGEMPNDDLTVAARPVVAARKGRPEQSEKRKRKAEAGKKMGGTCSAVQHGWAGS